MIRDPLVLAERLQLAAQIGVVVDFAVEGDGDRLIAIAHRLSGSVRQVDDREPAMPHAIAHTRDHVRVARPAFRMKATDDAAHGWLQPFSVASCSYQRQANTMDTKDTKEDPMILTLVSLVSLVLNPSRDKKICAQNRV